MANTTHYIKDIEERGYLRRRQTIEQFEIPEKISSTELEKNDLPSENSLSNQLNKTDEQMSNKLPLLPSSHIRSLDLLKKDSSRPWVQKNLRTGNTEAFKAIVQKSCTSASTTKASIQAEKGGDQSSQNKIGSNKPLDHDALKKEICLTSKHLLKLPPLTPKH